MEVPVFQVTIINNNHYRQLGSGSFHNDSAAQWRYTVLITAAITLLKTTHYSQMTPTRAAPATTAATAAVITAARTPDCPAIKCYQND